MFTQCPKCETVFKLSAEVLRAAGGQVRCGRCGEVFNALARLAEDASTFLDNESAIDLEERADSILESAAALKVAEAVAKEYEDFVPAGIEIARLQVIEDWSGDERYSGVERRSGTQAPDTDSDQPQPDAPTALPQSAHPDSDVTAEFQREEAPEREPGAGVTTEIPVEDIAIEVGPADEHTHDEHTHDEHTRDEHTRHQHAPLGDAEALDDASLEFTLPPGELDRIFIESKSLFPQFRETANPLQPPAPEAPGDAAPGADDDTLADTDAAGAVEAAIAAALRTQDEEPAATPPQLESMPHPERRAGRTTMVGHEVPETVRRELLEGLEPEVELPALEDLRSLQRERSPAGRAFYAWLGAGVVLALLLTAQIVHRNAIWLGAHAQGPFGVLLRSLSGAMGTTLPPPANLSAYQVRQWGVTGDPSATGILRLRASILNAAPQLQPYPLLRVTLADRFGKRIGTRDFQPAEYVGKPVARMLAPGERADAILDILDPGKNAEDFEIDVCLRAPDRVRCANDAAPQVNNR